MGNSKKISTFVLRKCPMVILAIVFFNKSIILFNYH